VRDFTLNRFQGAFAGCLVGNVLGSFAEKLTRTEILEATGGNGIQGFDSLDQMQTFRPLDFRGKATEAFYLPTAVSQSIIVNGQYLLRESLRHQYLEYRERKFVHEGANSRGFAKLAAYIDVTGNLSEEFRKFAPPEDPEKSNGNGVAKRIWPLGLHYGIGNKLPRRSQLMDIVLGEGLLTHYNILASIGAYAVVRMLRSILSKPLQNSEYHYMEAMEYTSELERIYCRPHTSDESLVLRFEQTVRADWTPDRVSGFVMDSIPFIFNTVLCHSPDFQTGLLRVINVGGSTCANGALIGAILGAKFGARAIPREWQIRVPHLRAAINFATALHKVADRG